MNAKVYFLIILIAFSGCTSLSKIAGRQTQKTEAIQDKINDLKDQVSSANNQRLSSIGALSQGVERSLGLETNQSTPVTTAREINQRIQALADKPKFSEVKMVYELVDMFQTNQVKAAIMLAEKDKEIISLNRAIERIQSEEQSELQSALEQGKKNALQVDSLKAELNEYEGWFGLKAVWKGLIRFVKSSMWILGIGSILFLILRLAAMSNPIAAGIFSIFNLIGSWFVNVIQVITPKAVSIAGNVSKSLFDNYKITLTKIIDAIQLAKNNSSSFNVKLTVEDVIKELKLTPQETEIVNTIKKELNWK